MTFDDDYIRPHPPSPGHAYPQRRPQRSSVSRWITPLLTLLALCGLIILGTLLWREYKAHQEAQAPTSTARRAPITPRGDLSEIEKTNIAIYKKSQTLRRPHHLAVGPAR